MVREWIDNMRGPAMWRRRDVMAVTVQRDLSERDGTRDQQFDNSMTHNDSQNALVNANVIVESIYYNWNRNIHDHE